MARPADYYQTHREAMLASQKAYYYRKQANDPEYKARRKEYMLEYNMRDNMRDYRRDYMREYSRKRYSIQKETKILMAILS
jgi:hypothetical protein